MGLLLRFLRTARKISGRYNRISRFLKILLALMKTFLVRRWPTGGEALREGACARERVAAIGGAGEAVHRCCKTVTRFVVGFCSRESLHTWSSHCLPLGLRSRHVRVYLHSCSSIVPCAPIYSLRLLAI